MNRFSNLRAFVTGGNSGIGLATAKRLAAEGARVVITGRDLASLKAVEQDLGPQVHAVQMELLQVANIQQAVQQAAQWLGGIDLVFANAGSVSFFPVDSATERQYDELMDNQLKGTYFTLTNASSHLAQGASVVVNSSIAHVKGVPNASAYGAAKAAIRSLARTLSAEWLARGIRVNSVSPGPIETPILARTGGVPLEAVPALKEQFASSVPMKRMGTADEVASAVLFLLSRDASYITGIDLPVDGGAASL